MYKIITHNGTRTFKAGKTHFSNVIFLAMELSEGTNFVIFNNRSKVAHYYYKKTINLFGFKYRKLNLKKRK